MNQSSARAWVPPVIALGIMVAVVAGDARGGSPAIEAVRADYRTIQDRLARLPPPLDASDSEKPEISAILDKVWPLVGAWLVAHLQEHPDINAEDVAQWVSELDPQPAPTATSTHDSARGEGVNASDDNGTSDEDEDETDRRIAGFESYLLRLQSYRLSARALRFDDVPAPAYAVAVTYGLSGRLFVVSRAGTFASADIHRRGVIQRLPDSRLGKRRFYVDARSDDWPAGMCRGGQLSVWEWDGEHAVSGLVREYSDMGPDPAWGVHVRGTTAMAVYTRGELRTFGESCSGTDLKAVRKIHLGPERIEDHGLRYYHREFQLADDLLYRTLRGEDISDIAAPDVATALTAVLRTQCRRDGKDYYLSMLSRSHVEVVGSGRVFDLGLDDLPLTFLLSPRDGRWYATGMRGPDVAVRRLQAAIASKAKELGLKDFDPKDRRKAADVVLRERPELDVGAAKTEDAVTHLPPVCEGGPWPWR